MIIHSEVLIVLVHKNTSKQYRALHE